MRLLFRQPFLLLFCLGSLIAAEPAPTTDPAPPADLAPASEQILATEQTSVTHNRITWTFAEARPVGRFCTGDPWVVGPVVITGITTTMHADGFAPGLGQDGSMLDPGVGGRQGYDDRLNSYDAKLNAGLIDGRRVGPDNALTITKPAALVSMVSWLYRSAKDAEPGIPGFNGGTKAPRPVTRSGAILTVLDAVPPADSFRPPYCGPDRSPRFTLADLDLQRLADLDPVKPLPDPKRLTAALRGPWIDHVHEYLGAMIHPSQSMPNYGRDLAGIIVDAALMLQIDAKQVPGYDKTPLAMRLVQLGIDCAGIADAGGGWPANGGHGLGRKLPILIAGALLKDEHMLGIGTRDTRFHEDEQTFYVDEAAVATTNGPTWAPDNRAKTEPYTAADIGMPEWGIRHVAKPHTDNRNWGATYRDINAPLDAGFALAASIMDLRKAWNHEPLFDYAVRVRRMTEHRPKPGSTNGPSLFLDAMCTAYMAKFIPEPAWYTKQKP